MTLTIAMVVRIKFLVLLFVLFLYCNHETTAQELLHFTFKLSGINLEPIESDWGVDGFVKVYLNGKCKGRSETIKNNKNPTWRYLFKIPFNPGYNQELRIEVRHNNKNGKDDQIGDVGINLDLGFFNPLTISRDGSSRGKIRILRDMMPNDELGSQDGCKLED